MSLFPSEGAGTSYISCDILAGVLKSFAADKGRLCTT